LTAIGEVPSIAAALIRDPWFERSVSRAISAMTKSPRKLAFVTAATDHGTMIVNRFDRYLINETDGYGVGLQLLEKAFYDPDEVSLLLQVLDLRRRCYGDGVVAIDCGANVGVHTLEWAKHMSSWGAVLAIEAQERIFYALAGNIAINNCFNARAINAAASNQTGTMKIPVPNYSTNGSFGSLELRIRDGTEFIGQPIDYSPDKMIDVPTVSIDSLNLARIDVIKIDVEGMELEALAGGAKCIASCHPILLIESVKTDKKALRAWLENLGYLAIEVGMNILAVHNADKSLAELKLKKSEAA
jgi:FkbM family methyltransferase